ncbi:hypothetical protein HPB48_007923 [Haemaphysalis longicornis]|uniref:Uncharacterized protein n=1 Tax=Haemaphysalis longicornis TaxID=44386 RepID=A0A9J6FDV9_HAELO|nr:hypothetical protein HPB48_007923 [Haemaphysalis longicornis]
MREFGFERRIEDAWRQHGDHTLLSDNELLETIFTQHPELVYALDSPWNFRRSDCYKRDINTGQHIAAVHGDKDIFRLGTEPAFAAVYSSMKRVSY